MALPPFFNASSAAVLARGLAVTTTADPRAVEMPLLLVSLVSGSSRLIGAADAERGLHRLSASSNALSWWSTALDQLVSVLWLVRRTAGLCWPSDPKKRAGPSARSCLRIEGTTVFTSRVDQQRAVRGTIGAFLREFSGGGIGITAQ